MKKHLISIIAFILLFTGLLLAIEYGDLTVKNLTIKGATTATGAITTPSLVYTALTYTSSNTVVSYGITAATATFSGLVNVSSMTATNQVLADKLSDGVAYLKDGSLVDALTVASSSATITNTLTAGTLTDGTASISAGAASGFLTVASSSATITNTLSAKVIDFAVNLDTTTAPSSTGIVGLTSTFKMYVSTATAAGSWELIGSQS